MYWKGDPRRNENGWSANDKIGSWPSNAMVLEISNPYFGFNPIGN
jgi:hypothetical protein